VSVPSLSLWGTETRFAPPTSAVATSLAMLYALLYAVIRRVLRLSGISSGAEAKVLVLRHELAILAGRSPRFASRGQAVPLGDEQDAASGALGGVHRDPRPHLCGGTESSFGASGPYKHRPHRDVHPSTPRPGR
jgi:hypothetical protein